MKNSSGNKTLPKTILIVDDDLNVLEVLGARLTSVGFGILKAASGAEALQLLRKEAVDLMISDVKMPNMGGVALFREAKTLCPDLPIVFLTAHGTIPSAVSAVKSGADDYLEKPFDGRDLVERIKRILGDTPSVGLPKDVPLPPRDGTPNRKRENEIAL